MRQEPDIWASKSWFFRHAWNYWGWDQFHADSCERILGCSLDLVLTGGRVVLFFFFLLPEAGSTSTEPICNHKPESKPVIKNFPCPPEHTISGVHDQVRHKTNMWKERSPLAHGIRQSSPSRWERCNRSHRVGSLWHRLNSRSRSGEGAAKLGARLPLKCFLTATALHQLFPSTWRSPSRPEQCHQLGIVRPWAFQGPFKFKQNHFLCFNCLSVSLLVFFP